MLRPRLSLSSSPGQGKSLSCTASLQQDTQQSVDAQATSLSIIQPRPGKKSVLYSFSATRHATVSRCSGHVSLYHPAQAREKAQHNMQVSQCSSHNKTCNSQSMIILEISPLQANLLTGSVCARAHACVCVCVRERDRECECGCVCV